MNPTHDQIVRMFRSWPGVEVVGGDDQEALIEMAQTEVLLAGAHHEESKAEQEPAAKDDDQEQDKKSSGRKKGSSAKPAKADDGEADDEKPETRASKRRPRQGRGLLGPEPTDDEEPSNMAKQQKSKAPPLQKGSPEAKRRMAELRKMRGKNR